MTCSPPPLVGRNGAVDWLCLPRFDSASCFSALLGDGTLVLESDFESSDGAVRIIDFMPRRGGGPPHLTRIVEGVRGRVPMFERLIGLANDLGLLAEEYDVGRGRQVGNFPQAFSHLTLILAARAISAAS